jgi:hypothetical protein
VTYINLLLEILEKTEGTPLLVDKTNADHVCGALLSADNVTKKVSDAMAEDAWQFGRSSPTKDGADNKGVCPDPIFKEAKDDGRAPILGSKY